MRAKILTVLVIYASVNTKLIADDAVLTLTASGLIVRPPHWEDATNKTITNLNFDFSSTADFSNPNQDVNSQLAKAKLVDADKYPARIAISRPQNCFIGQTQVQDKHVHFIHEGHAHEANDTFKIFSDSLLSYGLRFSKNGGYRDKSGAVTCLTPGTLTNEY